MKTFVIAGLLHVLAMPVQVRGPTDMSAPAPLPFLATGLPRHAEVNVRVIQHIKPDSVSVGEAKFRADRSGRINLSASAPLSGTYHGRDALGLFWSGISRPIQTGDPGLDAAKIVFSVKGKAVASATVRLRPAMSQLAIRTDTPFPGALWAYPNDGHSHPVVIVLGGSEGGGRTARDLAPLFAARGYAVIGLPYYDPGYDPSDRVPGLPTSFTEIPVDRLLDVRRWLQTQSCADTRNIGLWGVSKGAEFALIAASYYPWIKAAVAIVPSDLVWEGWGGKGPATASFSMGGRPLNYMPYAGMDREQEKATRGERMDIRRVHAEGRAANPTLVEPARIPIERFRGRLLLVAGGADQVWPSSEMARNIVAARRRTGLSTILLMDPLANHFLGGPGTRPTSSLVTSGADPAAIAHLRASAWLATFRLFSRSLHEHHNHRVP